MLRKTVWYWLGERVPTHEKSILILYHTLSQRSKSNGSAEAFFGRFKRDDVDQACPQMMEDVTRQCSERIERDNHQASHRALEKQSPPECYAKWLARNKTKPVENYVGRERRVP
jgi:hypothetical protein